MQVLALRDITTFTALDAHTRKHAFRDPVEEVAHMVSKALHTAAKFKAIAQHISLVGTLTAVTRPLKSSTVRSVVMLLHVYSGATAITQHMLCYVRSYIRLTCHDAC
jgi:hypothetical protein